MKKTVPIEVHRYNPEQDEEPAFEKYEVPFEERMKLLDALKWIQKQDPSFAFRWNCGEGVCGSDAMRLNGQPVLACKTELTEEMTEHDEPLTVEPLKVFPVIKDLVGDYSQVWDEEKRLHPHFEGEEKDGDEFYTMHSEEVKQAQQMRRCINCMACYDVCHVIRDNILDFIGPRNIVKAASLDLHPKDTADRSELLEEEGLWHCNVTRCCSHTCPQNIRITEDAIVEEKERSLDEKGLLERISDKFGGEKR